jgi:hypothetical protein
MLHDSTSMYSQATNPQFRRWSLRNMPPRAIRHLFTGRMAMSGDLTIAVTAWRTAITCSLRARSREQEGGCAMCRPDLVAGFCVSPATDRGPLRAVGVVWPPVMGESAGNRSHPHPKSFGRGSPGLPARRSRSVILPRHPRRTHRRRFLSPGFGCPCCSRRGLSRVLFAAWWTGYLNSASAAEPCANYLVAAVFRTKQLLRETLFSYMSTPQTSVRCGMHREGFR